MNLDELQSVRDRERQSDSLQQLRDSFYADAGELIGELRAQRDHAADRAEDPFDDPEVNRITDDINTAEQTVEAIYERRVGKLVKMASFAAADMPTEDEGLTAEERELFEGMVESIERNRDRVFAILDGEDPDDAASVPGADADGSPVETGTPESAPAESGAEPNPDAGVATGDDSGVDAADLMGSGEPTPGADAPSDGPPSESTASAESDDSDRPVPPQETSAGDPAEVNEPADAAVPGDGSPPGDESRPGTESATDAGGSPSPRSDGSGGQATDAMGQTAADDGGSDVDRRTVRITQDVGEILGVDQRAYDLASEDVVTLPAANAEPLVERDAAEPLDR